MVSRKNTHAISIQYLKRDKHLGACIRGYGQLKFRREHTQEPFQALCESIIYQQISGTAAASILKKFKALWPKKKFPTSEDVLSTKIEKLRTAGISPQKALYLKDLALKFNDGTVNPKKFGTMSDAEIIQHVVAVKGVGEWTAQMFLMFTLGRPDILPTGDLGIQKGFKKLFDLKNLPTPAQMQKLSQPWGGHRTVACFYLWRLLDENK